MIKTTAKINDVKVIKFRFDGVDFEKTCKVIVIEGRDKKNRTKFHESQNWKSEYQLDELNRVIEIKSCEKGVVSVIKHKYENGKIYTSEFDGNGNLVCEYKERPYDNCCEVTKDSDGNQREFKVITEAGKKIETDTYSNDGKIYQRFETHYDVFDNVLYKLIETDDGYFFESWSEYNELGDKIYEKKSNGYEYRMVKSDDGKYFVRYDNVDEPKRLLTIAEVIKEGDEELEIVYSF